MVRRVVVAAIGIPVAGGVVYAGGWVLVAALAALAVVGTHEFYRLAAAGGVHPVPLGLVAAGLFPLAAYAALAERDLLSLRGGAIAGAAWLILTVALAMRTRGPEGRPLAAASISVFGALYAGGLPSFVLALRYAPDAAAGPATALVFLPLIVTWVADSLAMAAGATFGGPKLAPVLSPKKTWAGALAHGASALVTAPAYGRLVLGPLGVGLTALECAAIGLAVSVAGQLGDLGESLFKREARVKDSGRAFPGHGGVLDRLDALYWAVPTTVALLVLFGRL